MCSARGRPDEGAQRAAHDLVVTEQVAAHLEGAQRAPHALLVGRRGEHLGPCGGADLVVGEVELREARVAPEGRGEQRATLRRGAEVPWCGGAVVRRCRGAEVPWCGGAVVGRCRGAEVPWWGGAVVGRCRGAEVPWCGGAVVRRCRGGEVPW